MIYVQAPKIKALSYTFLIVSAYSVKILTLRLYILQPEVRNIEKENL